MHVQLKWHVPYLSYVTKLKKPQLLYKSYRQVSILS